jgi:O-antigen/teichoic acid export membrane protein
MKHVTVNIVSLFSADMIRRILGFVSVVYLARVLGASGFGMINLGFAVLAYGAVVSAAGLPTFGMRHVAQGGSDDIVGVIFSERLASAFCIFIFIAICSFLWIPAGIERWVVLVFAAAMFPQALFLDWYFQGKETMKIIGAARVCSSAVYTALAVALVHSPEQILWVAGAAVLGDTCASLILIRKFKKEHPEVRLLHSPSFGLLKQSLPLSIGVVIAALVTNYPPFVLGIFQSTAEIGIYSAANKLVFFLLIGDRLLSSVFLPASMRKQEEAPQKLASMISIATHWILIVALPIAVGAVLFADRFIVLVFGDAYIDATGVLKILVWYFFLTMLHTVFTSGLIAVHQEKAYGRIMAATAFLYGVLVALGAIYFGALGAAFGVVLAEGASLLLMWHALRKSLPLYPPRTTPRILAAACVMELFLIVFYDWNILLLISAGAVLYVVCLWILRAVRIEDIKKMFAKFA